MATKYPLQQVGVADGTLVPANRADAREVNANKGVLLASKSTSEAWNSGDLIFLGKKPAGVKITDIKVNTGTSTGSATIAIGDGTTADKYVAAVAVTTTNVPVQIGPKAATVDDAIMDADEELWATIASANIASGTALTITIEYAGII